MTAVTSQTRRMASLRRISALMRKEGWQVMRDPSSIAVGIVMPMVLLVLFGYGLSFDLKNVPVAHGDGRISAEARGAVSGFELSDYFQTRSGQDHGGSGAAADRTRPSTASSASRSQFARDVQAGTAEIQVVVNGSDANTARISLGYAQGAVATWLAREAAAGQVAQYRRVDRSAERGYGSTKPMTAAISWFPG